MRIKDKIEQINTFLEELSEIIPDGFEQYSSDFKTKAACERYFEKIIEAVIDLCFLVIKENGFSIPSEDKDAIRRLEERNIISGNLSEQLQKAKSMRNIIAHEYGIVDDELVFTAISEDLLDDVKQFIDTVEKTITMY